MISSKMKINILICFFCLMFFSCTGSKYYSIADFEKAPKTDVHFHYDTWDDTYLKYASSMNMHLFTINVDAGEPLEKQAGISKLLEENYPEWIDFLTTFSIDSFECDNFSDEVIMSIEKAMSEGAKGVKIWKNIGMALKGHDGEYVMIDHPAFIPIFEYLQTNGIPLMAHLGEPRNCWLPYDEITMNSDLRYYKKHPEYHMYQHPDAPSYEEQIAARDQILENYPDLKFVGAHIGSLEWSIEEVANRFEKYPNFNVDLSARMGHIQFQTIEDREKVRSFFIKYQDRILYGSDMTLSEDITDVEKRCESLKEGWRSHWLFLATDDIIPADKFNLPNSPETIQGLQLPREVVDRIFNDNAKRIFPG